MPQVHYNCRHPFTLNPPGTSSGYNVDRPWVEVECAHLGHVHRVWCLVDTGADDTILDLGTAAVLGIAVATLPQVQVSTAGGSAYFGHHRGIGLRFAGAAVVSPVLFGVVAVPLLGRSALLDANFGIEAGFDATSWQHT